MGLFVSILVSDILPIFAIAGAGFLLARYGRVDVKMLSRVVFYAPLALPGLSLAGHLQRFRAKRCRPHIAGRADHGRHGVTGIRGSEGAGPKMANLCVLS